MLEIFKGSNNLKRLKKRTSSAIWQGQDELTTQEGDRYNNQMGYN